MTEAGTGSMANKKTLEEQVGKVTLIRDVPDPKPPVTGVRLAVGPTGLSDIRVTVEYKGRWFVNGEQVNLHDLAVFAQTLWEMMEEHGDIQLARELRVKETLT